MQFWTILVAVALTGCAVDQEGYCDGRTATCESVIAELEAKVAALEADHEARLTALEDGTYVPTGIATTSDVDTALASAEAYADQAEADVQTWVGAQGYATTTYVDEQDADQDQTLLTHTTELASLDTRLSTVEGDYLTSADYSTLEDAIATNASDLYAIESDYLTSTDYAALDEAIGDNADAIAAIEADYLVSDDVSDAVRLLDADTTYAVSTASDLTDGLAELDGYRIASDVTVSFELAAGSYSFSDAIVLDHPDGAQIEIVGAGTASTTLSFSDCDGIVVEGGSGFGYLGELALAGDDTAHSGLTVQGASAITVGTLDVQDFGTDGILVQESSSLVAEDVVALDSNGTAVLVTGSSYASLDGAEATSNDVDGFTSTWNGTLSVDGGTADSNGSMGFYAAYGGSLAADDSSADSNNDYGYYAAAGVLVATSSSAVSNGDGYVSTYGGNLQARYSAATYSASSGYYVNTGSVMYAASTRSQANGSHGYYSATGAVMEAIYAVGTGNTGYSFATAYNGYIRAPSATSDSINYAGHDTTDFIFGL